MIPNDRKLTYALKHDDPALPQDVRELVPRLAEFPATEWSKTKPTVSVTHRCGWGHWMLHDNGVLRAGECLMCLRHLQTCGVRAKR